MSNSNVPNYIISIAMIVIISVFVISYQNTYKECEEKGGKIVATGKYKKTEIFNGETLMSSTTEIKKCTK